MHDQASVQPAGHGERAQSTQICAPNSATPGSRDPRHIGGSVRGYLGIFSCCWPPSAVPVMAQWTVSRAVYLYIAALEVNVRICRIVRDVSAEALVRAFTSRFRGDAAPSASAAHRACSSRMGPCILLMLPQPGQDLEQRAVSLQPAGDGLRAGPEVMPVSRVTLSDGHGRENARRPVPGRPGEPGACPPGHADGVDRGCLHRATCGGLVPPVGLNTKPSAISLQELRHPPYHLRDLLADVDAGQHGRDALAQIDRRRRLGDHVVAGHVDPAGLIHLHVGVGGQPPADMPVGGRGRPRSGW